MRPAALAALHARCFTMPRPWSEAEFAELLESPHAFLVTAPGGFLLGRVIAGEAELLTVAVAPESRRRGTGRALLQGFAEAARARAADTAFLEVAEDNAPARALYRAAGWAEAGRRRGYYHAPDGRAVDALILTLPMGPAPLCP